MESEAFISSETSCIFTSRRARAGPVEFPDGNPIQQGGLDMDVKILSYLLQGFSHRSREKWMT